MMSDRRQTRKPGGSTDWQQMSKAERRVAAKAAKARAAAAKRRRQRLAGVFAGLAVAGVVIGAFFLIRGSLDSTDPGAAQSPAAQSSTASGGTPATGTAGNAAFPSLPAGADPALATKPTTEAGTGEVAALKVTPIIEGTGPAAQNGQQITVNYVGVTYHDGKEFDASWNSSQPFSFQLGGGNVIAGWDKGLVGVKVGSRVQLDIPSNMAYGDNPGAGRPGGPLRFIVDVLAVQ